jgi:hypothetical protein
VREGILSTSSSIPLVFKVGVTFGLCTTTPRLGTLAPRLGAITLIYEHKHDPAQKDENKNKNNKQP